MKKKFVLFVAIVLVAVAACVSLVGCTGSTPNDFMTKWFSSNKKTVYTYRVDEDKNTTTSVYLFDGNLIQTKSTTSITDSDGKTSTHTIIKIYETSETDSGCYSNIYTGNQVDNNAIEWEAMCIKHPEKKDMPILEKTFYEILIEDDLTITTMDNDDFKKNFSKSSGWYTAKIPFNYGFAGIKFDGKAMLVKFDSYSNVDFNNKYVVGCEKLTIPKEAIKALIDYNNMGKEE